jgi:ectoine hydroxylase-related dioxygenase (phytanoyl-CoA dioxygenase family)
MLSEFRKNGYVLLNVENKKAFGKFNASLESLIKHYCRIEAIQIDDGDYFHNGYKLLDKKNHNRIHDIYNILRNSNVIYNLITLPEINKAAKIILSMNENDPLNYFFHVCRMDPPGDDKFILGWHQEDYGLPSKSSSLRLWAPLVERNGVENGSIDVLVGSHNDGELPHYICENNGYNSLYIPEEHIELSRYQRMTVELDPGQVLLLAPNLVHKSNYNKGTRVRYSLTAHFKNPIDVNFELFSKEERFTLSRTKAVNYNQYNKSSNKNSSAY